MTIHLILNDIAPIHWALAGAGVAAVTIALLFLANRRLGISTGFEDLCSLALPWPYFRRGVLLAARGWRLPFVSGLVLGGALSAVLGGGWHPTWALGMFDRAVRLGPAGKLAWMFTGGLFIGFGTRLAGGCTSGHGIFGLSNFERPSVVATLSFMAGGIATTHLIYGVFFP
ncbi:MAG: YeeE/YedE thiosulfate transporter family protein [Acidobacteriota bacterium]